MATLVFPLGMKVARYFHAEREKEVLGTARDPSTGSGQALTPSPPFLEGKGEQNQKFKDNSGGLHKILRLRARSFFGSDPSGRGGFTLLEVMISLAVVAIALTALLGLQHQNLQSVVRANDMTKAALLAQELMTQAEIGPFPPLGVTAGNFETSHPRHYRGFKWEQSVEPSAAFQDVRKVRIRIFYGPRFGRKFDLVEFIRNPFATPENGG